MNLLDFDRLQATKVSYDPFAHILLPQFVRPAFMQALSAALPPIKGRGSFPIGALRLGAAARDLVSGLESETFRRIIGTKFELDLAGAPVMTTLRGRTEARDGQIHTDSAAKRVTILLYLNESDVVWAEHEGCLRLLRDGENLENYAVEVPPVDGALLVFPNGPTTFHGHKKFIGKRYALQMNYLTNSAKARAELRRHHVSAFFKRLTRAA